MKVIIALLTTFVMLFAITVPSIHASEFDFRGQTVTLLGQVPSWNWEEGGIHEGRHLEAEEKFNCQIEWIAHGDAWRLDFLMTRLLAGESTHDIWLTQQRSFWPILAQGGVYPVSEILGPDYFDNLPSFSKAIAESLTYHGDIYGFGVRYRNPQVLEFVSYNTDLFEREGLPDLQNLYEDGDWTWDAMTDIAIQATADTTGDGDTDRWGIGTLSGSWVVWKALSNDARVSREIDGRLTFTFHEDPALETMHQIYEWREVHEVMGGDRRDDFIAGDMAMRHGGVYDVGAFNRHMEEDFRVVPLPLGPSSEKHRYPAHALFVNVLPANAENPEALIALYDFLLPKDDYDELVDEYLIDQVRDRKSFEILRRGHDEWAGEVFHRERHILADVLYPAVNDAITGERSPAAAMEEIRPEAQAIIDDLFDQ